MTFPANNNKCPLSIFINFHHFYSNIVEFPQYVEMIFSQMYMTCALSCYPSKMRAAFHATDIKLTFKITDYSKHIFKTIFYTIKKTLSFKTTYSTWGFCYTCIILNTFYRLKRDELWWYNNL